MKDFTDPRRYAPSATQDPGDPRLIPTASGRSRRRLLVGAGVVVALGLLVAGAASLGLFRAVYSATDSMAERIREAADERRYTAVISPIVGALQIQQNMIGHGLRTSHYSVTQWAIHIEDYLEDSWAGAYEEPSALVCAQAPGKGLRIRIPGNFTASQMQQLEERIRTVANALFDDPNAPAGYRSVFAVSVDTRMRRGAPADGQYLHLCIGT